MLQSAALLGIGLAAAYRLAIDLRLGPVASLTFLTIFLMNGHLIAHLETGHLQWAGYLLLPGVLLFVHRAAAGDLGRRTQAGLALTLALIELVGAWHVFVWAVIWIGVFVVLDRSRWRFGASLGGRRGVDCRQCRHRDAHVAAPRHVIDSPGCVSSSPRRIETLVRFVSPLANLFSC